MNLILVKSIKFACVYVINCYLIRQFFSYAGKHEMYSFKETSTCEYEVMVLSPLLCSHPDYRPESANEQHINCQPADKETATKPLDLVKTEQENYKMLTKNKMYEADFFQGTKGPGIFFNYSK